MFYVQLQSFVIPLPFYFNAVIAAVPYDLLRQVNLLSIDKHLQTSGPIINSLQSYIRYDCPLTARIFEPNK